MDDMEKEKRILNIIYCVRLSILLAIVVFVIGWVCVLYGREKAQKKAPQPVKSECLLNSFRVVDPEPIA